MADYIVGLAHRMGCGHGNGVTLDCNERHMQFFLAFPMARRCFSEYDIVADGLVGRVGCTRDQRDAGRTCQGGVEKGTTFHGDLQRVENDVRGL